MAVTDVEPRTNGHVRGLTADEFAWRIGAEVSIVRTVLRDEHRLGRVRFDPATGCYRLAVEALDPDVLEALPELRLV